MSASTYKNLLFTTHAVARMKERGISQENIFRVIQMPDHRKGGADAEKPVKFIRTLDTRKYHIVAQWKKSEQKWLVISVWVRGEDDKEALSIQLLMLPWRVLWWILKTVVRVVLKK